jgi:hypothetical protein
MLSLSKKDDEKMGQQEIEPITGDLCIKIND